jgi:hypothetical protein
MARPASISIGQVSKAAKTSVEKALADHHAAFPSLPEHRIGFIPPHWWFGFVIYNPKVDKLNFDEAQKLATQVHGGIAGAVPNLKAGKPGVVLGDGNLTIGFAPPNDIGPLEV